MFKDKTVRTSILTGLISSAIFLIFFQPIFEFLGKMFVKFTSNFYDGLIDSVYFKAASTGFDDTYGSFVAAIFTGIVLGTTITAINWPTKKIDSADKASDVTSRNKNILYSLIIPLVIMVYFLYISILNYSSHQMYAIFMQRVTAITPYTTDAEIKQINSKWSLMKKKNDYNEINKIIDEIATANQLDIRKPY